VSITMTSVNETTPLQTYRRLTNVNPHNGSDTAAPISLHQPRRRRPRRWCTYSIYSASGFGDEARLYLARARASAAARGRSHLWSIYHDAQNCIRDPSIGVAAATIGRRHVPPSARWRRPRAPTGCAPPPVDSAAAAAAEAAAATSLTFSRDPARFDLR
jgi:hypothetical protein